MAAQRLYRMSAGAPRALPSIWTRQVGTAAALVPAQMGSSVRTGVLGVPCSRNRGRRGSGNKLHAPSSVWCPHCGPGVDVNRWITRQAGGIARSSSRIRRNLIPATDVRVRQISGRSPSWRMPESSGGYPQALRRPPPALLGPSPSICSQSAGVSSALLGTQPVRNEISRPPLNSRAGAPCRTSR